MAMTIGLSISDLNNLTYGMVSDMIIEKNNDDYNYCVLATQEDFDRF